MFGRSSASGDFPIRVLYDGWPLLNEPAGSAAIHLLELIQAAPEGIEQYLALPRVNPSFSFVLPDSVIEVRSTRTTNRLRWEQSILPELARKTGANLLHLTSPHPPVISPVPCLVSPAVPGFPGRPQTASGFWKRLRESLGQGGLSTITALLWPENLPAPAVPCPIVNLPPVVHQAFFQKPLIDKPLAGDYVLAPGPLDPQALDLLGAIWSWVAEGLGDSWALCVSDLSEELQPVFKQICEKYGITANSAAFDTLSVRAAAIQRAAAVLILSPSSPWGDVFLQALAAGRPLVGINEPGAGARVGRAAYLAAETDARALGAAVVTVLVEEPVAESLRQAARELAAGWSREMFRKRLGDVYRAAAHPRRDTRT